MGKQDLLILSSICILQMPQFICFSFHFSQCFKTDSSKPPDPHFSSYYTDTSPTQRQEDCVTTPARMGIAQRVLPNAEKFCVQHR